MAREDILVKTFVTLADTLVDAYDLIDFLQNLAERCVELLEISAAGIMLVDSEGRLRHIACSSEQMRLVELFEIQVEQGPCFDAFSQHAPVLCPDPEEATVRWPTFAPHAQRAGFLSIAAVPMRLRDRAIGALNLFSSEQRILPSQDVRLAQALADVATIGVLQERALRDSHVVSDQLQGALDSRVVIEQAKGIVAEHLGVSIDDAFQLLRSFARNHNRLLAETCRQVIDSSLRPDVLGDAAMQSKRPPPSGT